MTSVWAMAVSPPSGDQGRDVIARLSENGGQVEDILVGHGRRHLAIYSSCRTTRHPTAAPICR